MGIINDKVRVLFLCTANCFRSQMAEALLRHRAGDRFEALSAGSHPAGYVHPVALRTLEVLGVPTVGQRSKSWDEFKGEPLDLVITLCDNAARETCPVWIGGAHQAHWPLPDPVSLVGSEDERLQFSLKVAHKLCAWLDRLIELNWTALDPQELHRILHEIGKS